MARYNVMSASSLDADIRVVVLVVVNGSYSAAPYSSPDRECITNEMCGRVRGRDVYPQAFCRCGHNF